MPKVLSGSRFWVVPIGLIQHQLLKRRQLMDKGTSNSSVATAVSKTNPTTTPDGAKSLLATLVLFYFYSVLDPLIVNGSNSYSFCLCRE